MKMLDIEVLSLKIVSEMVLQLVMLKSMETNGTGVVEPSEEWSGITGGSGSSRGKREAR